MLVGITGVTGGLGRRMVEIFLDRGINIRCFVRETSNHEFLKNKGIDIVYGDLSQPETIKNFVDGIDICIHLAANTSNEDVEKLNLVNVKGTENICEALYKYNSQCRLLYCSSIVVKNYRWYKKFQCSNYTISKCKAEKVVDSYQSKLKTTKIYPGYIYGHYDRNVFPNMIELLDSGLNFFISGGEKNAPLVYVDDLCELFYQSMCNDIAIGKSYVSLEEHKEGMHDIIKMFARELHKEPPKKTYPKMLIKSYIFFNKIISTLLRKEKTKLSPRVVSFVSSRAKYFNNAKDDFGWKQKVSFSEGIKLTVAKYWRENVIHTEKLDIKPMENDGRCKWLEKKILGELLPKSQKALKVKKNLKIFVIKDWISNDGGHVGVDLKWLDSLRVPVVESYKDITDKNSIVVNTGYDSIVDQEKELRAKGIKIIDEPCPFIRKVRNIFENADDKYQYVLLCEPNHIIIKNFASIFPTNMILVQMTNYKEQIKKYAIGKPICFVPYVTFLPQQVQEVFAFIKKEFPNDEHLCQKTSCMWVQSKVSPIQEILKMNSEELENIQDALLITTPGSTNKSLESMMIALKYKNLNVVKISSLEDYMDYENQHCGSKVLLVRSPIPNKAEKPIMQHIYESTISA